VKLLLVDDHALFREGVALLLASLEPNVEVLQAGSCESAMELIATTTGIEIVLMDLQLPGASGLEAIRLLRDRYPELPVVAWDSADHSMQEFFLAVSESAQRHFQTSFLELPMPFHGLDTAVDIIVEAEIWQPSPMSDRSKVSIAHRSCNSSSRLGSSMGWT